MSRVYRLAVVNSHPIQYFAPLYRRLAQEREIDLTVYYCSRQGVEDRVDPGFGKAIKWDIPLLEGYRYKFLPNWRRKNEMDGFAGLINPSIIRELRRERFDAVWIHGYMHATNWMAFSAAWANWTPILLRGESHLLNPRPPHVRAVKEILLPLLLRRVAGCLCIGSLNRDYWRHYRVPEDRLFLTPYAVNNDYFQRKAESLFPQRQQVRQGWGIPDGRPVILYAGKLVPWKQPQLLLEAYRRVRQELPCALLYIGDGPLRTAIEERIRTARIPDVYITGFLNQTEISRGYIAGDLLVLPSDYEPWGLVVNEAMNFKLPIVVSDRVGCGPDLVRSGENGYVFPNGSTECLEKILRKLARNPGCLRALGRRSFEMIQGWGLEQTADGVARAVVAVAGR